MKTDNHRVQALYFSPTSTTKKAVKTIASTLSSDFINHDITLVHNRKTLPSFTNEDLLVIGVPVYAGRIPLIINDYIHSLKGNQTPVVLVGVYGNRDYDDALLELKDILSSNGFIPVAAGAFIGEHSYTNLVGTNRPDDQDVIILKAFAKDIDDLLNHPNIDKLELKVKGNYPYKELKTRPPLGPVVSDQCTLCNACVDVCPSGALSLDQQILVDEQLCIQCCACVKTCSEQAISFKERIGDFEKFLIANCSERKEPEVFLAGD